jgi:acetylornithine deacetylase/succinyl-diaminopimelate desuccinylase-like protein
MALGHVYHRALPIHRYRLKAITTGGHAWIHAGRPSAIHHLCVIGAQLTELKIPSAQRWSLNIGQFEGGVSINTIAPSAWCEIDLRAADQETLNSLDQAVKKLIRSIPHPDIQLALEPIGDRPGGGIPDDHELVVAACDALNQVGIHDCRLEMGSTDASIPLSMGLPAVCIGITYGTGAHSLEEYIEIKPMKQGFEALIKTLSACYKIAKTDPR